MWLEEASTTALVEREDPLFYQLSLRTPMTLVVLDNPNGEVFAIRREELRLRRDFFVVSTTRQQIEKAPLPRGFSSPNSADPNGEDRAAHLRKPHMSHRSGKYNSTC